MNGKDISDNTIDAIAEHINKKISQPARVTITTIENDSTSPHYYEIVSFDEIDKSKHKYFAIDGSYNSQEFYNGIHIGLYTAGYLCFHKGKQIRLNENDDPLTLGKSYFPNKILITNNQHRQEIFNELLELKPIKNMVSFFNEPDTDNIWGLQKEAILTSVSKLLSFCQEVLEWSLVLEILQLSISGSGDFILRDGTLRSLNIKQKYLIKLGQYAKKQNIYLIAVTKSSPVKLELSSSFKKIDLHLEREKKTILSIHDYQ